MTARLSLRPDLDQNVDGLPLYITGTLPYVISRLAYEGRLQIHNAVGRCSVEILAGSDDLPPGSSVYIDHATQEVVIAWPAYSQYVTPLENPGFETGDTSGWSFTPRGGNGTPVIDTAYRYEGTHSLRWPGGRGMGNEGGIEVEAWNNTVGPCLPGQRVTTRFRGMYNPAGHHFGNQYRALVRFLDSAGNPIGSPQRGQVVKGRGQNGRWNVASVSASGPNGTAGVQFGAWLTGSNAPVWMDAASWDVPSELGVDEVGRYRITLRVRDSSGRAAIWTGELGEFRAYITSAFYPVTEGDSLGVAPLIVSVSTRNAFVQHTQAAEDYLVVSPVIDAVSTRPVHWSFGQLPEDLLSISPLIISASTRLVKKAHAQPAEDFLSVSAVIISASTKTVLSKNTMEPEFISVSPIIIGVSLS